MATSIRFQMSYKKREAPIYIPMEKKMMEEMVDHWLGYFNKQI